MRYYIKADLDVRLESNGLMPGSIDFQLGAILADETPGILGNTCKSLQQIGEETWDNLAQVLPNGFLQDRDWQP